MSRSFVRGALLLGAAAALNSCDNDDVLNPRIVDTLFDSYVAIGNSITAGYQSGGINDSTQRLSYAALLARQMGTRYAYPSLRMPGCPPPLTNVLTGARVTPAGAPASTSSTCALRNIPVVDSVPLGPATLNNVAVPGLGTADATALGTAAPRNNPLTQLILGGETMVHKAIDVGPTFATVWMGNNDILGPALSGLPAGATSGSAFQANYAKMMNELVLGAPGVKGVLIGVGQVAGLPIMFQAVTLQGLLAAPASAAAIAQIAGRPVFMDPVTCSGAGLTSLINLEYLVQIRARPTSVPGVVFCQKIGGTPDLGDAGILDPAEQVTVRTLIDGYNAYIKAKADSIGFAYYDPNPLFVSLRNSGAIPPFPSLTSAQTFGQYISLDGIHPSTAGHVTLANEIIAVINTKYGTKLATIVP
jgi:hypothetical protein